MRRRPTPGQVCYEAFCLFWCTYGLGERALLAWSTLTPEMHGAWEAAAQAAIPVLQCGVSSNDFFGGHPMDSREHQAQLEDFVHLHDLYQRAQWHGTCPLPEEVGRWLSFSSLLLARYAEVVQRLRAHEEEDADA